MIRGALASRYGINPLGRGVIRPASGGWWLSGGIAAANCIAAYQAKGAASIDASYINLATPGTYNLTLGKAPAFDTTTGWTFNGSDTWLSTGVIFVNNQTWSLLIRIDSFITTLRAVGLSRTGASCDFGFYIDNTSTYYYNGGFGKYAQKTSGVLAVAGNTAYYNGISQGSISSGSGTASVGFPIGAMDDDGSRSLWLNGTVQAVAIYNAILTEPQVAAVTTAMAAL